MNGLGMDILNIKLLNSAAAFHHVILLVHLSDNKRLDISLPSTRQ